MVIIYTITTRVIKTRYQHFFLYKQIFCLIRMKGFFKTVWSKPDIFFNLKKPHSPQLLVYTNNYLNYTDTSSYCRVMVQRLESQRIVNVNKSAQQAGLQRTPKKFKQSGKSDQKYANIGKMRIDQKSPVNQEVEFPNRDTHCDGHCNLQNKSDQWAD